MKKPSTTEKLLEALSLLGCWEDTARAGVFRVFRHDQDPGRWFFLGKGGALRVGNNHRDSAAAFADRIRLLKVWEDSKNPTFQKASNQ